MEDKNEKLGRKLAVLITLIFSVAYLIFAFVLAVKFALSFGLLGAVLLVGFTILCTTTLVEGLSLKVRKMIETNL